MKHLLLVAFCGLLLAACSTTRFTPVKNEASFSGDYIDVGLADVPPKLMRPVPPVYPSRFRSAGVNGSARVTYLIEPDGRTSQVQVLEANDVEFGEAARKCVAQWTFSPAQKDGRPVRVAVQQELTFNINF